jgi:hypothetical protein
MIAGKLKIRTTHRVDIDRTPGTPADPAKKLVDMIPFAQTDMAERFLDGIDPVFSGELMRALAEMHERIATKIETDGSGMGRTTRRRAAAAVRTYLAQAHRHFEADVMQSIRTKLRQDVEDMVLLMPKQDLAFVAEAIVNLTSIRRRVANEEETVGGPIDVAIISKGDGFVWVKRKHYFDAALNPRYMERVRGRLELARTGGKRHEQA